MLEDCLIESRRSVQARNPFTLVVSVITHGSIVAALILIPLFQNQLLPHAAVFEPLRPPEVRIQLTGLAPIARSAKGSQTPPAFTALRAPIVIPDHIADVVDEPTGIVGAPSRSAGGNANGSDFGGLSPLDFGPPAATPPPPPPVPTPPPAPPKVAEPAAAPTGPVRRGGDVVMSNLVHQVQPVYPPLAQKTRTEGVVLLEAVITREGTIDPSRIRVISGAVLLNEAAIEAVKQWRYRPTLLNKEPVEILTTITLRFTFN
jgi:periplasmic protein TonB